MRRTPMFSMAALSLLAATALPVQAAAQDESAVPRHYRIQDLGPVGPPPGQPEHLTNNGVISGGAADNNAEHAVLWYKRWKLDIGVPGLGGANSIAFGVNQWAQAVGEADTHRPDPNSEDFCGFAFLGFPSGTTCLPFVWQRGVMRPLPTLKDRNGQHGNNGAANQINNRARWLGLLRTPRWTQPALHTTPLRARPETADQACDLAPGPHTGASDDRRRSGWQRARHQ
jgi:hypothetical protein